MARQFPQKFRRALAAEITGWQEENLITSDVAGQLLARYPIASSQGLVITILTILGAVLVGLGALLFIGSNWSVISPFGKVAIIFAAIVAAHAAGWFFRFEPGARPKLGTAFLLLGSLFYGGGIWLIAQIFNLDANFPDGMLLWALGTGLSAIVTRVPAVALLANLLAGIWLLSNDASFSSHAVAFPMIRFALGAAFCMFNSYMARSPWTMAFGLVGSALWVAFLSGAQTYGLLAWGATLFGGYLWHKKNWQLFEKPFMYVGTISILLSLLSFTCSAVSLFNTGIQLDRLAIFFCLALGGLAAASLGEKKTPPEVAVPFLVTSAALLIACVPSELARMLLHNANLLAVMMLIAVAGLRRLHSMALVNISLVFFVFFIIARYFDMFFSMHDRSVFFVLGGAVLLIAGSVAEKTRRKLVEGFQS